MSLIDPIARSLSSKKKVKLFEDTKRLREADPDKDFSDLNDEETHDDSQAPIQGKPDEPQEEEPTEDDEAPEEEVHDFDVPKPLNSRGSSGRSDDTDMGDDAEDQEDIQPPEDDSTGDTIYENPLDNQYAVHFTLGDEISLVMQGLKTDSPKKGVIEGYDTEGFYKVKWSDESVTNGLTDIALESLVDTKTESTTCICGSNDFVAEGNNVVCDVCGRLIEGMDPLTLADKKRPKGHRLIRSEAHPISTADKPDIADAVGVSESLEDSVTVLQDLIDKFDGEFWSREDELRDDLESAGYTVEEFNREYIILSLDDEDDCVKIPVEGTARTFYLNFDKAKLV